MLPKSEDPPPPKAKRVVTPQQFTADTSPHQQALTHIREHMLGSLKQTIVVRESCRSKIVVLEEKEQEQAAAGSTLLQELNAFEARNGYDLTTMGSAKDQIDAAQKGAEDLATEMKQRQQKREQEALAKA